ncbi:MAG: hypothetical protein ACFB0D_19145 [Phormidesmis sp.]
MNSHANSSHSLEAEFHRILRKRSYQHQGRWKQWTQRLFDFLTDTQPLSIRQKTRRDGSSQWIVYEASSDTRCVFDTEQDVRIWLEERHKRGFYE